MRRVPVCLIGIAALAGVLACQADAAAGMKVIKTGDNYKIHAEVQADAKQPNKGTLAVAIEPTGGWHMDREKGPAGFTLEPDEATKLAKKAFKKADAKWEAGGKKIRFDVPYELTAKGPHPLKMKFRFVVCTDQLCQMKRFELTHKLGG